MKHISKLLSVKIICDFWKTRNNVKYKIKSTLLWLNQNCRGWNSRKINYKIRKSALDSGPRKDLLISFYTLVIYHKHGNSVTNSISSLLWIRIVISHFKSNNIIMSARVYFMKRVKDCKELSIISPQDEHVKTDQFTL